MSFPSTSFLDLSAGAGKLTRAMQPSAPVALQRHPPPSVEDWSAGWFASFLDQEGLQLLEPFRQFGDFTVKADGFGNDVLNDDVGHWISGFEFSVFALQPDQMFRYLRDAKIYNPGFFQSRFSDFRSFSGVPRCSPAFSSVMMAITPLISVSLKKEVRSTKPWFFQS